MTPKPAPPEPLNLTVHRLPGLEPAQAALLLQRQRRGRWRLLALLLVCAAPVIASYFTYYVLRPEGRRHFGQLVQPQRPLPAGVLGSTLDGKSLPLTQLRDQWLLVSVAPGACDAACQSNLYLQRQLRETLGREKERLDWVWLISDDAAPPPELKNALQAATVLRVPLANLQQWLEPEAGHTLFEHLYVVDPQGNWMLRFPAQLTPGKANQAKRDLDRLLRASAAWDQPARPAAQ